MNTKLLQLIANFIVAKPWALNMFSYLEIPGAEVSHRTDLCAGDIYPILSDGGSADIATIAVALAGSADFALNPHAIETQAAELLGITTAQLDHLTNLALWPEPYQTLYREFLLDGLLPQAAQVAKDVILTFPQQLEYGTTQKTTV